jgi:CRP-like cAMP-binding protein
MDQCDILAAIPLFNALSRAELDEIAGALIERRVQANSTIVEEGTFGQYMYLICEGEVKVSKMSDDGREKVLEILGPGAFFGEMTLVDCLPRSASVKATKDCQLLALSRSDFVAILRRMPDICFELLRELSRRLRVVNDEVRGLLFDRVEGRTRQIMRRLATRPVPGRPDMRSTPAITHQQLADLVGTSRETITRVVKTLKRRGAIVQQGKYYQIHVDDGAPPTAPEVPPDAGMQRREGRSSA